MKKILPFICPTYLQCCCFLGWSRVSSAALKNISKGAGDDDEGKGEGDDDETTAFFGTTVGVLSGVVLN